MTIPISIFLWLTLSFQSEFGVQRVSVSGSEENYRFTVTLKSDDTGCDQYADWWEVITPEGKLLYRRILAHSHVTEQPFARSGGPVVILPDTEVIVRYHMNNDGYQLEAMRGSVAKGFDKVKLDKGFGKDLEKADPQPDVCAF